jgi:hypothetical protein
MLGQYTADSAVGLRQAFSVIPMAAAERFADRVGVDCGR